MECGWCVVTAVTALLSLLVAYIHWTQGYWQRRGVPSIRPMFLLGNFGQMVLRKRALPYIIQDLYHEVKRRGDKFAGVFQLMRPVLMVTDPQLIRDITVKYFDHFVDRRPLATEKADEVFSRSLLVLRGDAWREMRHTLSPAFTGSKLRGMTELMVDTARQLASFFVSRPNPEEPVDVRDAFRRFSADVIASTAYGTVFDCINQPDNEFFKHANKVLDMKGLRGLVLAGYIISPKIMEILRIPLIPQSMKEYFFNLILGSMKYREEHHKTRPDMIQLLMNERIEKSKYEQDSIQITDLDIVSQAVSFFIAGFESVTTTLSFCALELAAHPEIQDVARAEVDAALARSGGQLSYDLINELKYLDMVVAEVTRMYPGIPMTDRVCTKRFEIPEHGLCLEPGTTISIPIYALQHDPEYFPHPERFDPERFSEENKHKIHPFTNIPFGVGPRNCIGTRFAVLEVKVCMAHLLATCEMHVCERTPLPLRLSAKAPLIAPEGDFWLTVVARDKPSLLLDSKVDQEL